MTPLAPHLTAFFREHLPRVRQMSEHTCDSYAYAFQLLLTFAAKRLATTPSAIAVEQLDASLVLAFLQNLETGRGNGARSRNARLAAIKSFARFLEFRLPACLEQVQRLLAIPAKKTDERLVAHLSREEMQAVLDAPNPRTRAGVRDRAMLHVAFAAGLRVSELVDLRLADVAASGRTTIHIRGKGRRERSLPLWKETTVALRAWLALRGAAECDEVFLNARGAPLSRAGFEYILAKYVAASTTKHPSLGAKRISPHVLRHTCAMETLQATHDIRKVALWLGHARIQTTEIYLRADPTEKLEALDAVAPPSLRRGRFRAPDRLLASIRPAAKG